MNQGVIRKRSIQFNFSSRLGQSIRYIVVHDTGNTKIGADSEAHFRYFNGGNRQASAHYFVDDRQILQLVEDVNASWHCGDGRGRYGITNQNSIGVEICINGDGDYEKAIHQTKYLIKLLMQQHGVPIERVVRHFDASGKVCPGTMGANHWARWHLFKEQVQEKGPDSLALSLDILVQKGIIQSPDYWLGHAREGKSVRGDFAGILLERVASYLMH
ncbi:peptidoglycan recognition protein family protein [Heliorestis convoluta]|uniref:N-acetylmuramoyl-L-alanine amidase n=1 Tax=Heliorestis convoluta TaxID=356322 RepID=A0A5Q2MYI8_9FIRM|nr:N-acetylmuramoyl-L-alanine amidase [Heliorestis convoluta]QGG46463.1 N-acetylmuramoyl-L-alanine amidase family protein [Heliorestis convoluta]